MRFFLILLLFVLIAPTAMAQEVLPSVRQCDRYPGHKTILILLDRSAPYDELDRRRLNAAMQDFLSEPLVPGTRILAGTVEDVPGMSKKRDFGCIPSCTAEEASSWTNRCVAQDMRPAIGRMAQEIATFTTVTVPSLAAARTQETGLAATIADYARQETGLTRLVLFTDFIEFRLRGDGRINFYRPDENFSAYFNYVDQQGWIPDLSGVEVVAFGFGKHLGAPEGQARREDGSLERARTNWGHVRDFWKNYFLKSKAKPIWLEPTYRGQPLPLLPETDEKIQGMVPLSSGSGDNGKPTKQKGAGK